MFKYIIRRILLMIPTFFGVTFLVFFILQKAPDGPFDRMLKQLKNQQGSGEISTTTSNDLGGSEGIRPDDLEKLRAQYGLDKNIIVRYLIWLGISPKETKVKEIKFYYNKEGQLIYNEYRRDKVDELKITTMDKEFLQKYIHIEHEFIDKNDNGIYDIGEKLIDKNNNGVYDDYIISESGVGLEFSLKDHSYYINKEDLDKNKYQIWKDNYSELTNNPETIKTWYYSNYIVKKGSQKDRDETFIDKNKNGKYDSEEFIDANENNKWDEDEVFIDAKNGIFDTGEKFTDTNGNNKWDENEPFEDGLNGTYDYEKFNDTNKNGYWDKEYRSITIYESEYEGILTGYLGYSRQQGKDVSALIYEKLPVSIKFGIASLIVSYFLCIPLGIIKAVKNGSKFDLISSIVIFIAYSIPGYILGVLLISFIRIRGFDWPISGLGTWEHWALPLLCYVIGGFAGMTVLMKNSLLDNLSQDYVRTAFAKGLSEKRVIFFHAVRNSLIPIATGLGSLIGIFLAGSYLIEKTFGIDGLGLLGFQALWDRDYNIIMGTTAISTIIMLLGNLLSDIIYSIVDPRIRFK